MMRIGLYLVVLCAVVGSMVPATWVNGALSVVPSDLRLPAVQMLLIVVLTHVPALLPVKAQAKYMGAAAKWFRGYPEIPVPVLVWIAWGLGGAQIGQTGTMVFVGAGVALCLGVAYAAVRVVDAVAAHATDQTIANPAINLAPLRSKGARIIYLLRVLLVLGSGGAVVATVALGAGATGVLLLAICCAAGAAALAGVGAVQMRELAKAGAADAPRQIVLMQQANPASVVMHYSQPAASKHLAAKALCKELRDEGLTTAALLREMKLLAAFGTDIADYLWPAPTIAHLDAYVLKTVRAVLYTNDAIKNGHFTRFNQLTHILVAKSGELAKADTLPGGLEIYDAVVAPDWVTAQRWRAQLPPEAAQRVVTVGRLTVNATLLSAIQRGPETAQVSVHVQSQSLEQETFGALTDGLFADVAQVPEAHKLIFWRGHGKPPADVSLIAQDGGEVTAAPSFIQPATPHHYTNYSDLIAHLEAARGQGA